MNNLLSYCGLVDARISASDNALPVSFGLEIYKKQIKAKASIRSGYNKNFCYILNIKWLPLKQSFCFLYAYRRTMTRMTKRTRRPMTTPMTEAMDTGSENKNDNNRFISRLRGNNFFLELAV